MKDALIVSLLSLAPRRTSARGMGWFARRRLSRWVVRWFVRAYDVDMSEAARDLDEYPTLEALFTRRLVEGVRPIDDRPGAMIAPVDGTVAAVGRTVDGQIAIAPGRTLSVGALADVEGPGEHDVAVFYLSPTDYHRVHVPHEGAAVGWQYVPGTLWPVFPAAVRRVKGLFSRNERAVVHLDTAHGPLGVVLVGAFGVGRITLSVCDLVTNVRGRAEARSEAIRPGAELARGDELGVFHLGSTVVLLAPPGRWEWVVEPDQAVRMGQAVAHATERGATP